VPTRFPLLLALLVSAAPLAAQPDGGFGALAPGDTATALLGGHLLVRLPAAAAVSARPHSIMGAPAPDETETRALIDAGPRRFVVFARELNRTAPDDFTAAVDLTYAPYREMYGALRIAAADAPEGALRVVRVEPEVSDTTREAVPLYWLLVAGPDGTVQEVGFFVNPEGARDPGARALADAIAASLQSGPRRVTREGRAVELGRGEGGTLVLDVPPGAAYARQEGPDFVVHRVEPLVPLGSAGPSGFGIYDGHHPNPPGGEGATTAPASVLGADVTWQLREEHGEAGDAYRADLILPHPLEEGAYLHVFVWAASAEDRARRMADAGALRVAP